MIGILGALGFAALKNPGVTAKYTRKAFGTGMDALRLGGKGLDKMGKYGGYTKTALKTGVGGYLGYQAGGMVGDFAADRYLAYEGDTESTQRTAATMRTGGRMGGALLGAGLPNAGAIMGGIGNTVGGLAGGIGRTAGRPVGAIRTEVRRYAEGTRILNKRNYVSKNLSFSARHPSRLSNQNIQPGAPLGRTSRLYNPISTRRAAIELEEFKRIGPQLPRLPDDAIRMATKKPATKKPARDGFLKRRLDPSPTGLAPTNRSFKTELGFGLMGVVGGMATTVGMQSQMPSNRVSAEGNITGIGSSPRGGISPELQMSTQGLTLGIHNRRKSRVF